jgi:glycosyltransferase involved in cell wall biosynthesis
MFDGDFIERHAKSLAMHMKVDVIHIVQNTNLLKDEVYRKEITEDENIKAIKYFIPAIHSGIRLFDAAIFNHRYYRTLHRALSSYIKQKGKPDIVHVHVPVKMGAGAYRLKQKFNIPFAVTEHSSTYFETIPENYFVKGINYKFVTKKTFEEAGIVSSVSAWLTARLQQIFAIKRTVVIPNAVDTSLFFPAEKNTAKKRFIHVSMMLPLKNVSGILCSLAKLNTVNKNWEMLFVGPASESLILEAINLKLQDYVIWKGALPYNEVAKEMQQADALVHFSKYENLPCVVNEALCCGIPVISSNVGGISELVNETNGIIVENENTTHLKDALLSFLANPQRFDRQSISKEATQKFNYKTVGQQILSMYQQVLNKS